MKFKGSKKIVSLFLAVLMVVSSVPAFALSASAAVNTSTDVSALEKAMHSYEEKMTSGKIYTNMANAYTYYIAAQKAYDACVYGYNDAYVAKATTDLTNATNAMTEWTAPIFNVPAYHMNNVATGAYKNVVYGPSGDTWWTPHNDYNYDGGAFGVKVALSNNVVTCYDGTDTYIPILLQCYSNQTFTLPGTRQIYRSIFSLADSNVNYTASLNHNWRFISNVTGDKWNSPENDQNLSYTSSNTARDIAKGKDCSAYNRVFLTSNNNSTYYDTIDYSNFVTNSTFYGKYIGGSTNPTVTQSGSGTAYIINYEPIKDRISELANYNVTNYKQGGLESLLSAIDACTAVNPNSYGYASNVANAVKECGDAIKAAMSKTYSVTADDTRYQTLRDAITDANTASTAKTADSLVAYGKAISEARNVFANDIISHGYNSPDNAETKATALNDAKSALADAYSDSTKDNFDAAVTVVKAMDMDALTADGQAYIQNLIDTSTAKLTTTLTDSDKTYYALATGQSVDTAKNITDSAVDELTKALLTFAASPDESYINHYNVTFAAQIEKNDTTTDLTAKTFKNQVYGTMITFDADSFSEISALENKSIKWTVQYSYADGSTKSQKIQSVGNSITLKATANMTVTAIVADETTDETVTNYTVKFYNIYNNVVDFTYITEDQLPEAKEYTGSQITIGDYTYTPDVPFYTLSGFKVSAPNANKVISVFPTYSATPTVDVTVYMGTATSKYMTGDAVVTAKTVFLDTSVDNFYAWAVQINSKYQIVAYNKDYAFAAITGATYTPIIKENGVYKVYTDNNGTLKNLTADDVYQFNNNTQYKLTDNDYLVAKLDTKAPFTYIETITTVNGKNRAYIRITANSSSVDSFGVFGNNSKKPLSGVNDITGQYSVDMSKLPADFKAYVSYSVKYTDKDGNTYNITTTDYATNA